MTMIQSFVAQISDVAGVFANDRGFHGLLGVVIFLVAVIALTRVSTAINEHDALLEVPDFLRRMQKKDEPSVQSQKQQPIPKQYVKPSRFRTHLLSSNFHGQRGWNT